MEAICFLSYTFFPMGSIIFLPSRYFSYQIHLFSYRIAPLPPSDRTSRFARSFEATCTQCTFLQRNVSQQFPESLHPAGKRASESIGKVFPMVIHRKVFPMEWKSIGKVFPMTFHRKTIFFLREGYLHDSAQPGSRGSLRAVFDSLAGPLRGTL